MPLQFLRARKVRTRNAGLADRYRRSTDVYTTGIRIGHEAEANLAASGELHIYLSK